MASHANLLKIPSLLAWRDCVQGPREPLFRILRALRDGRVLQEPAEDRRRPQRGHMGTAVCRLVYDNVAGQEKPDVGFTCQRAIGEERIAGSEDHVPREVDPELLLEDLLHIDLGQYAEAFLLQLLLRAFERLFVR